MIETREEYEELKDFLWNDATARQPEVSDAMSPIVETIEALRDVARAAKAERDGPIGSTLELQDALDALAPWLLEEE